jgi:L-asparaginase
VECRRAVTLPPRLLVVPCQDISAADRRNLADAVAEAEENFVLVTHGTDTMVESALALDGDARIRRSSKRIVFVGSFKPERFKDSDATFNIGVAIGALQVRPRGWVGGEG